MLLSNPLNRFYLWQFKSEGLWTFLHVSKGADSAQDNPTVAILIRILIHEVKEAIPWS